MGLLDLKLKTKPLYTAATAVYPYSKDMEKHFIVKTKYDPEPTFLAKKMGDFLLVPRELAPLGEDRRSVGSPVAITCTTDFKPDIYEIQKQLYHDSLTALKAGRSHTMCAVMGLGKCLAKGTGVIMYDGSVRAVENVKDGDLLMGPDSTPRTVTGTTTFSSTRYKITPIKGDPFVCNDEHILSLKRTNYFQLNGCRTKGVWRGGDTVHISVKDYLASSASFKVKFKLWRPDGIDFSHKDVFDPYIVGLYLADGTKSLNGLTCGEGKLAALDYVKTVISLSRGDYVQGAWHHGIPGFTDIRKTLLTEKNERLIPDSYLYNSREVRLQLLAGILDGDGFLVGDTVFDLVGKDRVFIEQVAYLCRSLGFSAYPKSCIKGIKSTGFSGVYWRIAISGNTAIIPTKIFSKKAAPRLQKKSVLVTGFSVERVDDGDVYGFCLDKDHLYLLQDFTVTHNTYLGVRLLCSVGMTTLIVVTKEDLMVQWKDNLLKYTNLKLDDIGFIQQDTCQVEGKKVVIGLVHSLAGRDYSSSVYNAFGLVICDECLSGDAQVTLGSGEQQGLSAVVTRVLSGENVTVQSFDALTQQFSEKTVTYAWEKGSKRVRTYTFDNGTSITCTADHRFYTSNRGWVAACELTSDDDVLECPR